MLDRARTLSRRVGFHSSVFVKFVSKSVDDSPPAKRHHHLAFDPLIPGVALQLGQELKRLQRREIIEIHAA